MTLRLRLVVALVVLVTAGLAIFGVATYSLYARSQFKNLDTELRSSESLIDQQLDGLAGTSATSGFYGSHGQGGPDSIGRAPVNVLTGTYAELRDRSGTVLSHIQLSTNKPQLPSPLPAPTPSGRVFTVGSTSGTGSFRVLLAEAANGGTTVIAAPTTEITLLLHRLVLLETAGSLMLLVVLCAGSWLILRRGLRPLERMAGTARTISSGNLSERVSPAGGQSEVGQLGLALNTMLDDIEMTFAERDATERRLRQFLADASHELRTPLTSIQGFAELFRVSGDNARLDLPTILRRIEEESARMKVIVEDLLLLARLDLSRAPEQLPVDLAVLAADACTDAVATARDRAITLDAPEPVVVAGDEALLRQAIANLVNNAVRHTPPGTAIEVGARISDGDAVVSVRDHGAGLRQDQLPHVFDRFWQADEARVGSGAGLGLAIVASVAAEHGGTVSAANTEDGGAEFVIRLPLKPPTAPVPPASHLDASELRAISKPALSVP
jgi:two-component system, OmpR family, sensor kinase